MVQYENTISEGDDRAFAFTDAEERAGCAVAHVQCAAASDWALAAPALLRAQGNLVGQSGDCACIRGREGDFGWT